MERAMTPTPIGGVTRLTLAALAVTATLSLASAHGPASGSNAAATRTPPRTLLRQRDCFELASSDVSVTAAGYFVHSTKETVPFSEALPSPDGNYWRCQWGGMRRASSRRRRASDGDRCNSVSELRLQSAHEGGKAGLALALEPLGGENRSHLRARSMSVLITT